QTGDRDRHVGAESEQLAALVEEAVRPHPAPALAALQDLVVLESRGSDVAVAVALEAVPGRRLERANLPHPVRKDLPVAALNRVDHRLIIALASLTSWKVGGDRDGHVSAMRLEEDLTDGDIGDGGVPGDA